MALMYLIWAIGLFMKVFYFQYSSGINSTPFFNDTNNKMLYVTISSLSILLGVLYFFFYKIRKFILVFTYILFSIILFGDTLYARYYYSPLNVTMVHQFKFVGDVQASMGSLFKPKDIIFFLDWPLLLVLYFFLRKVKFEFNLKRFIMIPSLLVLIGLGIFFNVFKEIDASAYAYQRKYIARDLGVVYYHYYDVKDAISKEFKRNTKLTQEEMELIFEHIYKEVDSPYYGVGEGKNLIVLQLEAFQNFIIQNTIEGEEITPVLNALIKDSFYFDNLYHQASYGNTADAEYVMNTSLQPARTGPVNFLYPNNEYYGLPRILREKGYSAYAFHAYEPSFWNRTNMHHAIGFERFYSLNDFEMTEKLGWALSDKEFFRQSIELSLKDTEGSKPFYAFMSSLSSHHPYDAFYNDPFPVGKFEGTQLGHYFKAARYVDEAVGELIDYLKEKDLYENSIIVIYGDHSAIFPDQEEDLYDYLELEKSPFVWKGLQQIPLLIHIPNIEGKTISTAAGQMDILPMVAHLLGLEIPFMLGNNLLLEEENIVANRDGSIITNEFMYLPEYSSVYLFEDHTILSPDHYMDIINKGYEQLKVTDIILEKNALEQLWKQINQS
jgi:phosphoglycerol transferase MdoB-like AlkP superfamily enzyme